MDYMTTYRWGKLVFSNRCKYTVETYDVSGNKILLWRARFFTSEEIKKTDESEITFSPELLFTEFIWIVPSYVDEKYASELYHFDKEHPRSTVNHMWSKYFNFLFHSRANEDYEPMLFNVYTNQGQIIKNVNAQDFQVELRDYENKSVGEHDTMMILGFEEIDSNFHSYDFEKNIFSDKGASLDESDEVVKQIVRNNAPNIPRKSGGCCGGGNNKK